MKLVKTITHNANTVNIMRIVKPGTKRVFFFAVTEDNKRIGKTLWARQWSAEEVAQSYLKSIN